MGASLQATFALFVVVLDTSQTSGRKALSFVIGAHTEWLRVGAACVADLRDGRMVLCDSRIDRWGDLGDPKEGRAAVEDLLRHFYPYPPPNRS